MAKVKEIKRYANRRLYDSETSKTITLEDVAQCIKDGYEVKVIDNITGDDITAKVLGQTFLKIFVDNKNLEFSNFLLTALIRGVGGNLSEFFTRLVQGGIGAASLTMEKLEEIANRMVEQGHINLSEKTNYIEGLLGQLKEHTARVEEKAAEGLGMLRREFEKTRNEKIEELSSRMDEMASLLKDIGGKPGAAGEARSDSSPKSDPGSTGSDTDKGDS